MKRLGLFLLASALMLPLIVAKKEKEKVKLIVDEKVEDKLSQEELDMKPFKLETEDGYQLTLFLIMSTNKEIAELPIKGAVLLHHGSSMDGQSWFDTKHESLPSLLVKAGFSVYLSNDRGTRNS